MRRLGALTRPMDKPQMVYQIGCQLAMASRRAVNRRKASDGTSMNRTTSVPMQQVSSPAFAARAAGITGSVIDSSSALLQRRREPTISFAMGCPAADAIPSALIAGLAAEGLRDPAAESLNYGPTEGEVSLRRALIDFLRQAGNAITDDRLLITAGGTQGLDLVAKLFIDPGDLVIAEQPSYTNGTAVVTGYQGLILRCPTDNAGMQVECLPELIEATGKIPKVAYVIPNSQNPGGTTLSLTRRKLL